MKVGVPFSASNTREMLLSFALQQDKGPLLITELLECRS